MYNFRLLLLSVILLGLTGCGDTPPVIHDLSNQSFELVNQDSAAVNFPSDYEGKYLVVAFIYTHCPDICRVTTANMKTAYEQLNQPSNVQFVEITFDPMRDTPSVLKSYMQKYKLDENKFSMLTGDSASVDTLFSAMDVDTKISFSETNDEGKTEYFMNHTDRIAIMDPQGRVRFEYPGSKVPVEHIVEDLNKIR